ncbi:MAG: hypothetical protein ACKVY0_04570, partial [Prosthecobacter sp.]|uniref:hypothetical protein n=1 Tax=Prosthecobacter sp. TaxID=1965333 RepID=UPI0039008FBB
QFFSATVHPLRLPGFNRRGWTVAEGSLVFPSLDKNAVKDGAGVRMSEPLRLIGIEPQRLDGRKAEQDH